MIQHEIFPESIGKVGFNNLWIHSSFGEFNCVSMSRIPSPIIQIESLARYLGGCIFSCSRGNCIFLFGISFFWIRGFGLRLSHLFTSQFQIWIFCYTFTYFVPFGVIENRVTKVNFKYFNGNFAEAWLFEKFIIELDASSYSFKITCILIKASNIS